ncbi:hypothetical protein BaRGS_00032589 [Batillaria attramentaria]|uniref:Uncharacterized protein n=1 Tax=Batillaria attramentaria TaxID=370345 RepID=A0ABD0JMA9_9CAEN
MSAASVVVRRTKTFALYSLNFRFNFSRRPGLKKSGLKELWPFVGRLRFVGDSSLLSPASLLGFQWNGIEISRKGLLREEKINSVPIKLKKKVPRFFFFFKRSDGKEIKRGLADSGFRMGM